MASPRTLLPAVFSPLLATTAGAVAPRAAEQRSNPFAAVDPDEDATYRKTIRNGVAEYQARRFDEARSYFRRAHEISPSARTLRGTRRRARTRARDRRNPAARLRHPHRRGDGAGSGRAVANHRRPRRKLQEPRSLPLAGARVARPCPAREAHAERRTAAARGAGEPQHGRPLASSSMSSTLIPGG
jgi:hypothetical protein